MSLFNKYTLYTHKNMLNAAILIKHSLRLPNGDYKLKVDWYRKDGLSFGLSEIIRIKSKEVANWREVRPEDEQTPNSNKLNGFTNSGED